MSCGNLAGYVDPALGQLPTGCGHGRGLFLGSWAPYIGATLSFGDSKLGGIGCCCRQGGLGIFPEGSPVVHWAQGSMERGVRAVPQGPVLVQQAFQGMTTDAAVSSGSYQRPHPL